MSTEKHVHVYL